MTLLKKTSQKRSVPKNIGEFPIICCEKNLITFIGLSTLEKFKITLEQIIQTMKGQDNYGNRIFFQLFLSFRVEKWEKKISHQIGKIFFQEEQFFFQPGKIFFPIFPGATLQKDNEISNQNNLLGLRKDRKYFSTKSDS